LDYPDRVQTDMRTRRWWARVVSLWQAEILASEGFVAGLPWVKIADHELPPHAYPGVVALIDHLGERFHVEASPDVRECVSRLLSEQPWAADYSILTTPDERDASDLAVSIAQRLQATGRRPTPSPARTPSRGTDE